MHGMSSMALQNRPQKQTHTAQKGEQDIQTLFPSHLVFPARKQHSNLGPSQLARDWKSRNLYLFNIFSFWFSFFFHFGFHFFFIPDLFFIFLSFFFVFFRILINHSPFFIISIHFSSFSVLFPWTSCVSQHVPPKNQENVTNSQQNPRILKT